MEVEKDIETVLSVVRDSTINEQNAVIVQEDVRGLHSDPRGNRYTPGTCALANDTYYA